MDMYFKRKRTFSKVVVRALATGTVLWVGGWGGGGGVRDGGGWVGGRVGGWWCYVT